MGPNRRIFLKNPFVSDFFAKIFRLGREKKFNFGGPKTFLPESFLNCFFKFGDPGKKSLFLNWATPSCYIILFSKRREGTLHPKK